MCFVVGVFVYWIDYKVDVRECWIGVVLFGVFVLGECFDVFVFVTFFLLGVFKFVVGL